MSYDNEYYICYKYFFFYKQGEWTDIKRQHRHPNYVGTLRNLHPTPPNSKVLLKKGGK